MVLLTSVHTSDPCPTPRDGTVSDPFTLEQPDLSFGLPAKPALYCFFFFLKLSSMRRSEQIQTFSERVAEQEKQTAVTQ